MSVVTFYSFKGGVGRTQAVANTAVELCKRGQRVIIVDMDLESPGVHAYFGSDEAHANAPGLLDYLDAWRTGDQPPNVDDYLVDVKAGAASIRVMGPGRLDGTYARRIAALSWERFYSEEDGDLVMERLREELLRRADTVLLDSRTGMTDIGTICTFHLPDVVVALFALHGQGIDGTALVAKALAGRMGEKESRLKRVLLVPSRVEEADGTLVTEWIGRARKAFEGLPPNIGLLAASDGTTFRIPYDRDVAYGEHVVVETAREGKLAGAYRYLVGQLVGEPAVTVEDEVDQWEAKAQSLARSGRADQAHGLLRKVIARRREAAESAQGREALARSLRALANLLAEVGRYAEAISVGREGVELCRLLSDNGDQSRRVALARALADLTVDLVRMGRREEALVAAREVTEHYRVLAEVEPESFAYELTASLDRLSTSLASVGNHQGALAASEESIERYRALAASDPDTYNRHLANVLNNVSALYGDMGKTEPALRASQESIPLLRVLAAKDPIAFRFELAAGLHNLSTQLDLVGRRSDAFAASEESLTHYRALTLDLPEVYQPDLATVLSNHAALLAGLGREEAALAAFEEAVQCNRSMPVDLEEGNQPRFARALSNLAIMYLMLHRPHEALARTEEALTLLRPLFARLPEAFAEQVTWTAETYLAACTALNRPPDETLLAGLPRPPIKS
jgi:tetratricopeptide (TPR) repeat protein/cellulose biosynthesis protein BcsQ